MDVIRPLLSTKKRRRKRRREQASTLNQYSHSSDVTGGRHADFTNNSAADTASSTTSPIVPSISIPENGGSFDFEFGDGVSRILNSISQAQEDEISTPYSETDETIMDTTTPEESLLNVSTHSDETLPLAQPITEAVLDDEKFLDRPLTKLNRDEFYSLMNKALGMDIKPP